MFLSTSAPPLAVHHAAVRRVSTDPFLLATADEVGVLVVLFSVTHIGLSAIRERVIEGLGHLAGQLNLVGRGVQLPSYWLADTAGLEVWPDVATAGRQIYRAIYTLVASALLFPALAAYPAVRASAAAMLGDNALDAPAFAFCFAVAAAAQAISIASLVNPSPLSLVPGFESDDGALLGVKRDDKLKLAPSGLTRITRHPLILPVVPWGAANALLSGSHAVDLILFGGLAAYAVAGCYFQDLRVQASNQVGTCFDDGALAAFYRDTSFVPFAAIADGRQSLEAAQREVPLAALALGAVLGAAIEWATLQWIGIGAPS